MRNHSVLLLFSILTIALFSGCSEDNKDKNKVTPPDTTNTIKMRVDTTAITLVGAPDPVRFLIRKEGFEKLNWSITSKPDWVELSKTSGSVEFWPDTLIISSVYDGLSNGIYNGMIEITSNGGTASIRVSLVNYPPELLLAKTLLIFNRDFYKETIQIQNKGGNLLYWKIENHPSWISVSDSSGISRNDRPGEVNLRVNLRQMAYGDYEDTMYITSNAGNSQVVISVSYYRVVEIYPGSGGAKIGLGECYDNIKKLYGSYESSSYVELKDGRLKHTISYNSRGFEFDFITNNVVLFGTGDNVYMRFSWPYDGLTEKNIGLDSPWNDVQTAYGDPDSIDTAKRLWIYNEGIGFEYNDAKTQIKTIHIFPPIEN